MIVPKERWKRGWDLMKNAGLDAMVICEPPGEVAISHNVYYLTGFRQRPYHRPVLVILPVGGEPTLVVNAMWDTRAKEWTSLTDIRTYRGDAFNEVAVKVGAVLQDRTARQIGVDGHCIPWAWLEGLRKAAPSGAEFKDCGNILVEMRMIKSKEEIELLRESARLAGECMQVGIASIREGMTEIELSLKVQHALLDRGLERKPGYLNLTSGVRSTLGAQTASDKKIQRGDIVAFDFGGKYQGYSSDFERVAVVGQPSKEQRDWYELAFKAEQAAVKAVRPGVKIADVDAVPREMLKRAGITYGHDTGHGVGLETHELPHISEGNNMILQPGMTFTVEPAVRVPEKYGMNLEDIVAVTETGVDLLSKFPHELFVV